MVGCREGQLRITNRVSQFRDSPQARTTTEVVHDVAVNVQESGVVAEIGYNMTVPDLVEERARCHRNLPCGPTYSAASAGCAHFIGRAACRERVWKNV